MRKDCMYANATNGMRGMRFCGRYTKPNHSVARRRRVSDFSSAHVVSVAVLGTTTLVRRPAEVTS